jgi:hypothetical protein
VSQSSLHVVSQRLTVLPTSTSALSTDRFPPFHPFRPPPASTSSLAPLLPLSPCGLVARPWSSRPLLSPTLTTALLQPTLEVSNSSSDLLTRESPPCLPCCRQIKPHAEDHSSSAEISVSPTVCGASGVAVQSIRLLEIQSIMHRPLLIPAPGACCPRPLPIHTTLLPMLARSPRQVSALSGVRHGLQEAQEEAGRTQVA